jgi:hypothetical protein
VMLTASDASTQIAGATSGDGDGMTSSGPGATHAPETTSGESSSSSGSVASVLDEHEHKCCCFSQVPLMIMGGATGAFVCCAM